MEKDGKMGEGGRKEVDRGWKGKKRGRAAVGSHTKETEVYFHF